MSKIFLLWDSSPEEHGESPELVEVFATRALAQRYISTAAAQDPDYAETLGLDEQEIESDGLLFVDPAAIEEILNMQADLQTGLGIFRLVRSRHLPTTKAASERDLGYIEDRLSKSLARVHRLLAAVGRPMYDPATHPEVGDSDLVGDH